MAEAKAVHVAERLQQGPHDPPDDRRRGEEAGGGGLGCDGQRLLPALDPSVQVPVLCVLQYKEDAPALLPDDLLTRHKVKRGEKGFEEGRQDCSGGGASLSSARLTHLDQPHDAGMAPELLQCPHLAHPQGVAEGDGGVGLLERLDRHQLPVRPPRQEDRRVRPRAEVALDLVALHFQ